MTLTSDCSALNVNKSTIKFLYCREREKPVVLIVEIEFPLDHPADLFLVARPGRVFGHHPLLSRHHLRLVTRPPRQRGDARHPCLVRSQGFRSIPIFASGGRALGAILAPLTVVEQTTVRVQTLPERRVETSRAQPLDLPEARFGFCTDLTQPVFLHLLPACSDPGFAFVCCFATNLTLNFPFLLDFAMAPSTVEVCARPVPEARSSCACARISFCVVVLHSSKIGFPSCMKDRTSLRVTGNWSSPCTRFTWASVDSKTIATFVAMPAWSVRSTLLLWADLEFALAVRDGRPRPPVRRSWDSMFRGSPLTLSLLDLFVMEVAAGAVVGVRVRSVIS